MPMPSDKENNSEINKKENENTELLKEILKSQIKMIELLSSIKIDNSNETH